MLKFDGPHNLATCHARLLYKKLKLSEDLSFQSLYKTINEVDEFINSSSRIFKAHDALYIYFFSEKSDEFWIGREVTGFVPSSVEEFKVFDSFRGEALSWDLLEQSNTSQWNFEQWIHHAKQLRSLAGQSLASTWRIRVSNLEGPLSQEADSTPQISFQFFSEV